MAATRGALLRIQVSGASTTMTGEATTVLTANKVYQITNTAKRIWDRSFAITVKNGGVAVDPASDPYTINRLTGTVTFTNTASRTITIDGKYLPVSTIALAHGFSLQVKANNPTVNVFGDIDVIRQQMSRDWSGSIQRFWSVDTYLADAFVAGVPVVIAIAPDGANDKWRGWGLLELNGTEAGVESWLEETANLVGAADVDGRSYSAL